MYPAVRLTGLLEPGSNMHGTTFMLGKHSHTVTQEAFLLKIYFMARHWEEFKSCQKVYFRMWIHLKMNKVRFCCLVLRCQLHFYVVWICTHFCSPWHLFVHLQFVNVVQINCICLNKAPFWPRTLLSQRFIKHKHRFYWPTSLSVMISEENFTLNDTLSKYLLRWRS